MAKYIMPHEMTAEEVLPMGKASNYILPHEVEAAKAAEPTPEEKLLAESDPVERGFIGAGKIASDIKRGIQQTAGKAGRVIGIENTLPERVAEDIKSERGARQAIAKDTAAQIGAGGAQLGLGWSALSAKPLQAALYGGMLEGPLKGRENPTWGNVATEGGQGALVGGLGGALGQYGVSALGKGKNAAQGKFSSPEVANRFRLFQEHGVPGSLGDVSQSRTAIGIENLLEKMPLSGRKDYMQNQANALIGAVEGMPSRIAGYVPSDSKEVLGRTIKESIQDKYKEVKNVAKSMYDDVTSTVDKVKPPPIDTTELRSRAIQLKNDYPDVFGSFQDSKAIKRLDDIISDTGPQSSVVLGPNGKPIQTPAVLNFDDARWLDKRLGSMIRQGKQKVQAGNMDPEAFNQLTTLQQALRSDIENWSKNIGSPEIAEGIASANKYFRENVIPFRNHPVTAPIVFGERVNTDRLPQQFFQLDQPFLADEALKFMTPRGIQAGRYSLLKSAKEQGVRENLMPGTFLNKSTLGESGPKLFSPDELSQVADMQELVRSAKRSASHAFDPATGQAVVGLTSIMNPKVSALGRMSGALTQSPNTVRYMLADPRLYTGSGNGVLGGLAKGSEAILRKSGIGPTLSTIEDQVAPEYTQ